MNQRPIKRRDMHVDGFDRELHETRIQYQDLNMHIIIIIVEIYSTSRNKHTIACIQGVPKKSDTIEIISLFLSRS